MADQDCAHLVCNCKVEHNKASPKAAILTVVIIAQMLARLLQASANANTSIAGRTYYCGIVIAIPSHNAAGAHDGYVSS
jgi:hypothetical protein